MGARGTTLNLTADNSTFIAWCLAEDDHVPSTFARLLGDPSLTLTQPSIWPYELVNALRTAERRERIAEPQALAFLDELGGLPIRFEHGLPFEEAPALLRIARRFAVTAYDAAYIHHCLSTPSALWTLDGNLRAAAESAGITTI